MRPDAEIALKIDSHESPRFAPTMLLTHQVEREWRISMAILT
jgi:hypothetical protein